MSAELCERQRDFLYQLLNQQTDFKHTQTLTENKLPSLTFFMGLIYSKRLSSLGKREALKNLSAVFSFVCRTLGFEVSVGESSSCFPEVAISPYFAEMQNVCSGDAIG